MPEDAEFGALYKKLLDKLGANEAFLPGCRSAESVRRWADFQTGRK